VSRSKEDAKARSVVLHMVSSLDGFIAKKDNSVSWLESNASVGLHRRDVQERRQDDLRQGSCVERPFRSIQLQS
jgi:hypothetical protein